MRTDLGQAELSTHRRFHVAIYTASHNQMLVQTLDGLWDKADRYRRLALEDGRTEEDLDRTHAEHLAMVDAIAAEDSETAAAVMLAHVDASLGARAVARPTFRRRPAVAVTPRHPRSTPMTDALWAGYQHRAVDVDGWTTYWRLDPRGHDSTDRLDRVPDRPGHRLWDRAATPAGVRAAWRTAASSVRPGDPREPRHLLRSPRWTCSSTASCMSAAWSATVSSASWSSCRVGRSRSRSGCRTRA